jgi:hypothetical protein
MRRTQSLLRHHRWMFQRLFVAAAASPVCSFSVKAIDRPAAEFINANVKLEWLLTAQFLTAGSIQKLKHTPSAPFIPPDAGARTEP